MLRSTTSSAEDGAMRLMFSEAVILDFEEHVFLGASMLITLLAPHVIL